MTRYVFLCFFILLISKSYSQSDSLHRPVNNYKRNCQTNLTGLLGFFNIQYEQAISKRASLSLIGEFDYPIWGYSNPKPFNIAISPQVRYYLNRKRVYNRGFYLSASTALLYRRSYSTFSINNTIVEVHSHERIGVYVGGGFGYQWIIKKRLVIDAGVSVLGALVRWQKQSSSNTWTRTHSNYLLENDNVYPPLALNIGYTF